MAFSLHFFQMEKKEILNFVAIQSKKCTVYERDKENQRLIIQTFWNFIRPFEVH
jgi:hypothetical protein